MYYVEEGGQWWWVWLLILGVWYFLNALFGLFMIAQIHISTPRFYRDALHDITTPALASIPAAILVPAFILLQRSHYGTNILVIAPVAALLRDLIWLWPIFLATYVHKVSYSIYTQYTFQRSVGFPQYSAKKINIHIFIY